MRHYLFCLLLLTISAASAGTLENCQQKNQDKDRIKSCVEGEHYRSGNQLREMNSVALKAVNQRTQEVGKKSWLREYRMMQARHVRARSRTCRKQETVVEKRACEADMNFAHIEQLTRFTE